MLNDLAREGVLNPVTDCIVIGGEPDMVQVTAAIAAGDNHDEITTTINRECTIRLSLQTSVHTDASAETHKRCRVFVQRARAAEN
jgi:hypothetical protein